MMTLSASYVTSVSDEQMRDGKLAYLDVLTFEVWDFVGVLSFLIDGTRRHLILSNDTFSNGDSVIVLSERRRLMDDTRSRIGSDIRIGDDSESSISKLRQTLSARNRHERRTTDSFSKVIEQRNIFPSDHFLSLVRREHFVLCLLDVLEESTEKLIADDEFGVSFFVVDFDVGEFGMNADGEIGGQSPGSRRPGEKRDGGIVDEREGDGDWRAIDERDESRCESSTHQQDPVHPCRLDQLRNWRAEWYNRWYKA